MSAARRGLDFDGLKRAAIAALPGLLPAWLPGGRWHGREFKVGSLRGEPGDSLSVNRESGLWADFATGDKGDVVDLYAAIHGLAPGDAARGLAEELAMPVEARPLQPDQRAATVIPLPSARDIIPELPVPADAPPPPATHPRHGEPEHVAEVRDADGALLYRILRFPPQGERRKMVVPQTFGTLNGKRGWHWKSPPAPRPLYGLPIPGACPVLVVEGEVKRDAADRLLAWRAACVSWPNGADGVGKADWTPLHGRDVLIWPDNDAPGRDAAAAIVNVLRGKVASIRIIEPPADAPKGWDLADAEREGWTGLRVWQHMFPPAPPEPPPPEPPPHDGPPDDGPGDDGPGPQAAADDFPFRCLGYDRGQYFFLPQGAPQVTMLRARDLASHASLLALARLTWWEGAYPAKGQFDAKRAANDLMRACERVGVFDPDHLRGRGVWLDEGRTVLHLGDRLLVDGAEVAPHRFASRAIYEAARPMALELPDAADNRHASGLLRLCAAVSWDDPERDGRLLAGWIVAAMTCGAMPWRPHLWLTSEAGGGKTWVMDNIVRPMLADVALAVQGKTTEAGLRAMLRLDARPVLFDEAETQNEADRARMQQVLDLARAASSEGGAEVVKGTREGGVARYRIRSCFAFSSINLGVSQAADESRIINLVLAPPADPDARAAAFDALKATHAEVMRPGFAGAVLARTLGLLPTIRHNADVLATAISRDGVSRRTGDTLGVLLACAYSLASGQRLDGEAARGWLEQRTWVREAARAREADPEWQRALQRLMQQEVRLVSRNGRPETLIVAELLDAVVNVSDDVPTAEADKALRRMGMRVAGGELRIANRSESAARAFAGTEWATGWRATLARAPGARRDVVTRFVGGALPDKAVSVPLEAVMELPP